MDKSAQLHRMGTSPNVSLLPMGLASQAYFSSWTVPSTQQPSHPCPSPSFPLLSDQHPSAPGIISTCETSFFTLDRHGDWSAFVLSFGSLHMFCPSGLCLCFVLRVFAHFLSFGSLLMFCTSGRCSCFVLAGNRHDLLVRRERYRQAGTEDY